MVWRELHAQVLCRASEKLLGGGERGTMAFIRCLPSSVVRSMSADSLFAPKGWVVRCVADKNDDTTRTITADEAVEFREAKADPVLLLVDTALAGAGMDGIYSAAREIDEGSLFKEAISIAAREVTKTRSSDERRFAEHAIKKARGRAQRNTLSPWTEFDFFVRVASDGRFPGEILYLLGLWPISGRNGFEGPDAIELSRKFVDKLLGAAVAGQTPSQRIASLKLLSPTKEQTTDLERFLRDAAIAASKTALEQLSDRPDLHISGLQLEVSADAIKAISLVPWYLNTQLAKWSGLVEQAAEDTPPEFVLDPDADKTGNYSKLEVRWKSHPDNLPTGAASYRVAIVTDLDEELASREVSHSGKKEEKCRFSNDDFAMLNDDALVSAKVVVSVLGSADVGQQESEEFQICFGPRDEREPAGVGKKVRTFSEGLIELEDRESVVALASSIDPLPVDSKGYTLLRTAQRGKSFRVYSPPLIREVGRSWTDNEGVIGRWRVRVRASGARAYASEFVPLPSSLAASSAVWERATTASKHLAERFGSRGGCGRAYDQAAKPLETRR